LNITLEQVGKKFNRQWLFKDISFSIPEYSSCAVIGNNGSGKSTLLQMIYGFQTVSKGHITLTYEHHPLGADLIHEQAAFVAPYLELLEEFTLHEMITFHFKFKPKADHLSVDDMISLCKLDNSRNKQIKLFSSGMKQRVKLALAFFSTSPLLFLDEPCSNLDAQGIAWYQEMIKGMIGKRTLIVASNQFFEHDFCDTELNIADYKKSL
jgi:ABC-type multidrug transport system ATPase subunit